MFVCRSSVCLSEGLVSVGHVLDFLLSFRFVFNIKRLKAKRHFKTPRTFQNEKRRFEKKQKRQNDGFEKQ